MDAIIRYIGVLSAPQMVPSEEYQGTEYKWRFIVFRPALFQFDLILIIIAALYFGYFFTGQSKSKKKATTWFENIRPILNEQFSKPSQQPQLIADGNSDFFNFSTGRRAIKSLHTTFVMQPRHDLFQLIFHFAWSQYDLTYRSEDRLQLEFLLDETASAAIPDFVWAVVAKDELSTIKNKRWDMTMCKAGDNSNVPSQYSVMTEIANVTETMLKSDHLVKMLEDPAMRPYFRSLSITDLPTSRPPGPIKPELRRKYVILSLAVPPTSDSAATVPLVRGLFQFIDHLVGAGPFTGKSMLNGLRPETRTKLKKGRELLDAELRADAERESKEAEKEAREAAIDAKRKAEKDRIAGLSASEQAKALERERKKTMRKQSGKMMKK